MKNRITTKGRRTAREALRNWAWLQGPAMQSEPATWQASDMITDLLLTFSEEDAAEIMHRVERDNREDR